MEHKVSSQSSVASFVPGDDPTARCGLARDGAALRRGARWREAGPRAQGFGEEAGAGVDGTVVFSPHERELVREYYIDHLGEGHCPPGLAKKQNGCLPPGQAKKRYAVGRRLDPAIAIAPLPQVLEMRIGPPPSGYVYGMVDGGVVKLATLLVVDAVNSFVH